jgi:hypothetical protein
MRPLPLALALAAALASSHAAAGDPPRRAAESDASYSCRAQLTPVSRGCLARCDATYRSAEQEDERWSCVQSCTVEHVHAIRECREDASATARASQPRHDAGDDDRPIAFDPARLSD